jgi:hypothetical protein
MKQTDEENSVREKSCIMLGRHLAYANRNAKPVHPNKGNF